MKRSDMHETLVATVNNFNESDTLDQNAEILLKIIEEAGMLPPRAIDSGCDNLDDFFWEAE